MPPGSLIFLFKIKGNSFSSNYRKMESVQMKPERKRLNTEERLVFPLKRPRKGGENY